MIGMKSKRSAFPTPFIWIATACVLVASCSESSDEPQPKPSAAGKSEASETALEQGQSGSEAVPDDYIPASASWIDCPCGMNASAWLEATVVGLEPGRLSLTLVSVLHGDVELEPGDSFSGDYAGRLLCGGTECQTLETGDAVLVGYDPKRPARPECAALDDCLVSCRAELAADAPSDRPVADTCPMSCEAETQNQCPEAPAADPSEARLRVVRWQDPLVFARTAQAEMTLALDQVSQLWADFDECNAHWAQSFYQLDGYPPPYYSTEAEELVYFPPEPQCD